MAKTRVSNSDLAWIFIERLRSFDECAGATAIAIVPSKDDGWTAVPNRSKSQRPDCPRRLKQIEKQLRQIYLLAKD
jgi:hypothetical protein